uniref:Transmembrane protein 208 n=1 Tax=Globodera rostochiensis TaxID=31243 RepID=A0A914I9C2_GLORO
MNQQKSVKRAARGQRQIYEENKQTLLCYVMASVCSSVLVFSLNYFLFLPQMGAWVGLTLSSVCQLFSVALMSTMMKTVRNERNQLVDAGLDLNDPNAFGEYCKDIVILCVSVQLLRRQEETEALEVCPRETINSSIALPFAAFISLLIKVLTTYGVDLNNPILYFVLLLFLQKNFLLFTLFF